MTNLDYSTATQLAAALRASQISSVELVNRSIARIETLDTRINAVIARDFDKARADAALADKALAAGDHRPLLGLPMTVKEAFNVAGLPTTWGLPPFNDFRPPEDALIVTRAKAAGAIVLGKTNVPLLLADYQSYNDIYGTTNNPWDLTRTPGGSSGGSAAALAAGYVPLELGSDIGGSLRVPAVFCGVYAHKPSQGLVPSRGHTPPGVPPGPDDVDLAVVGPMARSAADLCLLLDVIAGPDEPLATGYQLALPPPRHTRLADFRVLVLDTHPLLPTAQAITSAIARLTERLAKSGCRIAHSTPLLPDLGLAGRIYIQQLMAFMVGPDMPEQAYRGMQSMAAALPPQDTSLMSARVQGIVLSHRDWVQAERIRSGIRMRWAALFREWDVVVCPAISTLALAHDHSDRQQRTVDINGQSCGYDDLLVWPGVATLPGLPSTAIPLEISAAGLPVGVQVIGPFLEDRTTLKFAELVEQAFGGFVVPPTFAAAV